MNRTTFEREMHRARAFSMAGDRPDYWHGYQRGLRRAYHGSSFGTAKEHGLFMAMTEDPDTTRAEFGRGYRDGFGLSTAEAPRVRRLVR